MQKENKLLKVVEKDYKRLTAKLKDLENQFLKLQEMKMFTEREAKVREGAAVIEANVVQEKTKFFENNLNDKVEALNNINEEVSGYQNLLEEKDAEIAKLLNDQMSNKDLNHKIEKEKSVLELNLEALKKLSNNTLKTLENLKNDNENLNNEYIYKKTKVLNTVQDNKKLKDTIDNLEIELNKLNKKNIENEDELRSIFLMKEMNNNEINSQKRLNEELNNERSRTEAKIRSIEIQLEINRQQCDRKISCIDSQNKELQQLKSAIASSEIRNIQQEKDINRLKIDKETLSRLLNNYKDDITQQIKLHEIEVERKRDLEHEQNKLKYETLKKDFDARTTLRELEKVKDEHSRIIENSQQIGEELNTLRKHTELLQNQNSELHNELTQFVEIDEKVRNELNIKPRVEYLKERDNKTLQMSLKKFRDSQSPGGWSSTRESISPLYGSPSSVY